MQGGKGAQREAAQRGILRSVSALRQVSGAVSGQRGCVKQPVHVHELEGFPLRVLHRSDGCGVQRELRTFVQEACGAAGFDELAF